MLKQIYQVRAIFVPLIQTGTLTFRDDHMGLTSGETSIQTQAVELSHFKSLCYCDQLNVNPLHYNINIGPPKFGRQQMNGKV